MRTLKFIVNDQIIEQDPRCNFDNLVPGSEGYFKAEFSFSPHWDGFVKAATFWSLLGKEYQPQILKDGKSCIIPTEALKKKTFKIQVIGKRGDSQMKLLTNKVAVCQTGGRK